MKARLKPSECLMDRLATELGLEIPDTARFRRLYPGWPSRAAGAWLWCIERYPLADIGSPMRVGELLNATKLCIYQDHRTPLPTTEIYPDKEKP